MTADEQAIRALVARQVEAWNRGDAAAYGADCAEDVVLVNIVGMRLEGRAGFDASHARIFSTIFAGSTLGMEVEAIRPLGSGAAVVETLASVRGFRALPPGIEPPPDGVLRTRLLQVLERQEGAWRVRCYHNVAVSPQLPPAPPR